MKLRVPIAHLLRMASKEEEDQEPEEDLESHEAGRKPIPDGMKEVKFEASPDLRAKRRKPFGAKFDMTTYMREDYRKRPENAQK
jgi:hypothetical protein